MEKILITITVFFSCMNFSSALAKQIPDSLIYGYWAEIDYESYKESSAEYSVRYGSESILSGGLHVNSERIDFLDGILNSSLIYNDEQFDNKEFNEKRKTNTKNAVNYSLKDSILGIERIDTIEWVQLKIKLLNKDSLILDNPKLKYKEIYIRKDYSQVIPIKIVKIEFNKGPSLWGGHVYKLEIFSDGTCIYNGIRNVEKIGRYKGTLEKDFFDDFMNKLNIANIPSLEFSYANSISDAAYSTLKVYYNDSEIKSIKDYGEGGPVELLWIYSNFYDFEKKVKLEKY